MPHVPEGLQITTDPQVVDFASFHDVYKSVEFHRSSDYEFPADYMEKAFGPGVYGFFAFEGQRLVGVARVFSDDMICAWIAEICVHKDRQRNGVGHALLDEIISRFNHVAIYAGSFPDQVDFLRAKGIVPQSKLVACARAPVVDKQAETAAKNART